MPGEIHSSGDDNLKKFVLVKVMFRPGTVGNFMGIMRSIKLSNLLTLLACGDTIFN